MAILSGAVSLATCYVAALRGTWFAVGALVLLFPAL